MAARKVEHAEVTGGSDLSEDPVIAAENLGKRVDYPEGNELFIDIDSTEDFYHYRAMVKVLAGMGIELYDERVTESSTKGHYHIRVRAFDGPCVSGEMTESLDPMVRIALQAALGSDRKRELLAVLRILMGLKRPPTVFFEDKE